ncbi:MAG: ABC transporter permease [Trueperaceae bacterium]|nr:ABC transporter permease [Trueperaceae bacterium]
MNGVVNGRRPEAKSQDSSASGNAGLQDELRSAEGNTRLETAVPGEPPTQQPLGPDPAIAIGRIPLFERRLVVASLPLIATALFVLLWWVVKQAYGWNDVILPSPGRVLGSLAKNSQLLTKHGLVTLQETVLGYGLAILIAVPLGVIIGYSWVVDKALSPILMGLNAVPKVAVAPLLIIWMGFGLEPKIAMVVLLSFFPIILGAASGIKATPDDLAEMMRSLDPSAAQMFLKLRLRAALPQIFVGLQVAIALAVIGAVIGEFAGATKGLGYLITVSGGTADTALAFAALVILSVISIALYYIILGVERLLVPWADHRP